MRKKRNLYEIFYGTELKLQPIFIQCEPSILKVHLGPPWWWKILLLSFLAACPTIEDEFLSVRGREFSGSKKEETLVAKWLTKMSQFRCTVLNQPSTTTMLFLPMVIFKTNILFQFDKNIWYSYLWENTLLSNAIQTKI